MVFLSPLLKSHHFGYQSLLDKLKPSENGDSKKKVADIGCCFGQDLRQMILDGIDPKSIYAMDVHDGYWNAGREFFMDTLEHGSMKLSGVTAIFGDFALPYPLPEECTNRVVDSLKGNFDAIIIQAVLHCLSWEQNDNFIKRISSMLKPGGILIGATMSTEEQNVLLMSFQQGKANRYAHSVKSLNELLNSNGFTNVETKDFPLLEEFKNTSSNEKRSMLIFMAFKK